MYQCISVVPLGLLGLTNFKQNEKKLTECLMISTKMSNSVRQEGLEYFKAFCQKSWVLFLN